MKRVEVKDKIATCSVNSSKEIPPESEYLIKALCCLQLMCVDKTTKDDTRLKEVINIVQSSIQQITNLYKDEEDTTSIEKLFE